MLRKKLMAERYDSRIGAGFGNSYEAEAAAAAIRQTTGLPAQNVRVLSPTDATVDRLLEPESDGIAATLVRSHLVLGSMGLAGGVVLATLLILAGAQPFVSSPAFTVGLLGSLGLVIGLLCGGLVALRPDHDPLIFEAVDALDSGRWYVVVHTDGRQENDVRDVLSRFGKQPSATA